ncbi:hypothetical protein E4S40_09965 [Algoriphagus kandeliae]|uniref:Tetratricopeptide repeat protein n=1 Tax=Algoriphagus kandeliae TaxID=2562278 RepID=A0A4Y9QQ91_9BACT|nr:hypothetical protein [Algoriphagus kandeliae]TFV94347.1 hypothetical protein E4S40_09965 [Algoriphagus kandeliae]
MNANQFKDILNRADKLEKSDVLLLRKIQENFPYFQIPHVLISRYEIQKSPEKKSDSLSWAAITSPDRVWLRGLIEKQEAIQETKPTVDILPEKPKEKLDLADRTASLVQLDEKLKKKTDNSPQKEEKPKSKTRKKRASSDDLIESIKKKEKKKILDSKKQEQIDLIKAFSKKDIKLATIREIEANQNNENLAESSTKIKDELITESFAKLLIKQGKKEKALQIYKKLSLMFPEKSAYFADLIENLKNTD